MNIEQAEQVIVVLDTAITPITPVYPPLVAPPDGASAAVRLCYLLKGIAYLSDITICNTITDQFKRAKCIQSAYATYLNSLDDCKEAV